MSLHLISFKTCPFVQRAVITLKHKDIDFDITYIDLADPPDWFLEMSPLAKVPVLKVDDEILFESAVINEYLDEITGGELQPKEPLARAKNRAWIEFASNMLGNLYMMKMSKDEERYSKYRQALVSQLQRVEKRLDKLERTIHRVSGREREEGEIELAGLRKVHEGLEAGRAARTVDLTDREDVALRGMGLVSRKPIAWLLNVDDKTRAESADLTARLTSQELGPQAVIPRPVVERDFDVDQGASGREADRDLDGARDVLARPPRTVGGDRGGEPEREPDRELRTEAGVLDDADVALAPVGDDTERSLAGRVVVLVAHVLRVLDAVQPVEGTPGLPVEHVDGPVRVERHANGPVLDRVATALSAEMLGGTLDAFERTVQFLKDREQFGVKIGTFQGLKHRAARWFCEVELSKSIVLKTLRAHDSGDAEAPDVIAFLGFLFK